MSNEKLGPLPIVIGVTGHRDLRQSTDDIARLKDCVREIFRENCRRYPHTPFVLMSPLAAGADRLAAQVALEEEFAARFTLVVPMPFPESEYRTDFKRDGNEAGFDALLAAAGIKPGENSARLFAMPMAHDVTPEKLRMADDGGDPPQRVRQYRLLGAYLAHHAQCLIAFWNGKPGAPGGAREVMQFKLEGVPSELRRSVEERCLPPDDLLDVPETGPVFHILSPRIKDSDIETSQIGYEEIFPKSRDTGVLFDRSLFYQTTFGQLAVFNGELLRGFRANRFLRKKNQSREQLYPEDRARRLPAGAQQLRALFGVADALSLDFQTRTHATMLLMCVLVFLGSSFFAALAHDLLPGVWSNWLLLGFSASLFAATLLWCLSTHRDYQNKFQDYRALAEGLRVQFFWRLVDPRWSVPEHYLRRQKTELEWIRYAIRNWEMAPWGGWYPDTLPRGDDRAPAFNELFIYWVEDQRGYFTRAERRDEAQLSDQSSQGDGLIVFSLLLTVFLAVPWQGKVWDVLRYLYHIAFWPGLVFYFGVAVYLKYLSEKQRDASWRNALAATWKFMLGIVHGFLVFGVIVALARDDSRPLPVELHILAVVVLLRSLILLIRDRKQIARAWNLGLANLVEFVGVNFWPAFFACVFMTTWAIRSRAGLLDFESFGNFVLSTFHSHSYSVTGFGLIALLGGLLHYYSEKKAFASHVRQYSRMKSIFTRAHQVMVEHATEYESLAKLVFELGRESLLENGEWLLIHRERPLELPKTG